MKDSHFVRYELVWAQYKGYPYLPAIVLSPEDGNTPWPQYNHNWVYWFGEKKVSQIPADRIVNFALNFKSMINVARNTKQYYRRGVLSIIQECYHRSSKRSHNPENTIGDENITFKFYRNRLLEFTKEFPTLETKAGSNSSNKFTKDIFSPNTGYVLSANIAKDLENTKKYFDEGSNEDSVSDGDNSWKEENVKAEGSRGSVRSVLDLVTDGKCTLADICIACRTSEHHVIGSHPLFEGGICSNCEDEMLNSLLIRHYDGVHAYCAICFEGGCLYVCCEEECLRSYCRTCLKSMSGLTYFSQIESTENWQCFLCSKVCVNHTIPKDEWRQNIFELFMPKNPNRESFEISQFSIKRPIRVLSLFDGIGSGKIALDRLGIEIDIYYASEIDKDAILISTVHGNGRIKHIGDVMNINETMLDEMGQIDLLIGGSPCNDLALVNPARKGIWEGTGPLFFEFYRIRTMIQRKYQRKNMEPTFFWFFENVMRMEKKTKIIISRFLECDPVTINAGKYSPQNRTRFFWGNIPGLYRNWENNLLSNFGKRGRNLKIKTENENLFINSSASDVLTPFSGRTAGMEKINSITTNRNSLQKRIALTSHDKDEKNKPNSVQPEFGCLWINEIEKAFGFPEHFTDYSNLTPKRRQELLGKSWSVPVILHILSPLKEFFASRTNLCDTHSN